MLNFTKTGLNEGLLYLIALDCTDVPHELITYYIGHLQDITIYSVLYTAYATDDWKHNHKSYTVS